MEKMRRADRQIVDFNEILEVLDKTDVIFLALSENNNPYLMPLNFGYEVENGVLFLYLHGAKEGKKHNIIAQNPKVCFSGVSYYEVVETGANHWTTLYKSVIGYGIISEVKDTDLKIKGLDLSLKQYGLERKIEYAPQALEAVKVMRIEVKEITGKRNLRKG